ncbi:MAG: transcriptional regulator PpsR [Proteobacteria bacterium]|nr:transcriptional regulator PpsR [Pseudomonadota bacterium]
MKQFNAARKWLGDVDADGAARLLTATADIALVIGPGDPGIVRDVAIGNDDVAREIKNNNWVGKPWVDLVTVESRPKVIELLRDAAANAAPRWRHVNHPSAAAQDDLPVLYSATQLGKKGCIVAIGRSLRPVATLQQRLLEAQQAMDREYARLNQAETRHRLLFQVSSEAVLIAEAASGRVVEANPAAARLLEGAQSSLIGRGLLDPFDAKSRRGLETLLGSVRATGRTSEARGRLAQGGDELNVSVSLFREDRAAFFLVRLTSRKGTLATAPSAQDSRVMEIVESSPDAFLVTGLDGRVEFANRAFLDMVQLATVEQVRGEPLERWLGRPGVDFNLLAAHLREHGSIRLFATTLRGEYGGSTDVEICGVSVQESARPCLGFTIRNVVQRVTAERRATRDRPRSVEQLTELVGRVPLKELVRESSDMIEKLCIQAALELTGDNRASAAEILGLSRQSLYAKLRRYGLGDLESADDPATASGR